MEYSQIAAFMTHYGLLAIFVIIFLEYLNLPGLPAGIIMPTAGIMAAYGNISFLMVLTISTVAGILGSIVLYALGRFFGEPVLRWVRRKFPRMGAKVDRVCERVQQRGLWAVLICKLLPAVRTIVSIPAGFAKLSFPLYLAFASIGVFVWNLVFVGAGFFLGDRVLYILGVM
jgi:membrane protein DedA with SNARE-associated domain